MSGCCGCPNVSPWLCVQSTVIFSVLISPASSAELDTKFHLQGHIALAPTPGGQSDALALPEGFMAADDAERKPNVTSRSKQGQYQTKTPLLVKRACDFPPCLPFRGVSNIKVPPQKRGL